MKVRQLLETTANNHAWVNSRWWQKVPANISPTKHAFSKMASEALTHWPQGLRSFFKRIHGMGVSGNGIFDVLPGLMTDFEEIEHDFKDVPLESFYDDIVKLGRTFQKFHDMMKSAEGAFAKVKQGGTYDEYVKSLRRVRVPAVLIHAPGETAHVSIEAFPRQAITDSDNFTAPDKLGFVVRETQAQVQAKRKVDYIPSKFYRFLPKNALEPFEVNADEATIRLLDLVVHLCSWRGIFGLEQTSMQLSTKPLETSIQKEDWTTN